MASTAKTKRLALSLRRKVEANSFLNGLMTGTKYSFEGPESPPRFVPGRIHQVSRTTYAYHAESGSVRWADGKKFVFAIGKNPFQFFWSTDNDYFGRQLTEEDTFRFCQLMDVKRYVKPEAI